VHEIDDQELGTWSVVASASFSSLVAVWLASFFDLKLCLCGKPITKQAKLKMFKCTHHSQLKVLPFV
jgi:hypothetical protein